MSQPEQLALLLYLLGDEASQAAQAGLDRNASVEIRAALADFKSNPPTESEIEFVLDDFEKYFRFAMQTAGKSLNAKSSRNGGGKSGEIGLMQLDEDGFDVSLEPEKKFTTPDPTGNISIDLNRMHPYQVAFAIRNDQPATIALVLRNLATEHAAKCIEFLPDDIRPNVFLKIALKQDVAKPVLNTILQSAFDEARKVEVRESDEDDAEQMVLLMRSMPRDMRKPMLDELLKTDEVLANEVKSRIFQFDDLARLSDRDMQTILGQSNTDALVFALQGADGKLTERIFSNMSKRARETLKEEISFKTDAKPEEIEEGRASVVKVLAELEESGGVTLE